MLLQAETKDREGYNTHLTPQQRRLAALLNGGGPEEDTVIHLAAKEGHMEIVTTVLQVLDLQVTHNTTLYH